MFSFAEKITSGRKGLQGFSSAFGLLKAQTKLHLVLLYQTVTLLDNKAF